ncbi:MAG: hypothetical protein GYB68_19455 [Chloroflexi bacterium]|nr:hypothetical protein [Chloroflexota bacterium]
MTTRTLGQQDHLLKIAVRANGIFCASSGAIALALAEPFSSLLGIAGVSLIGSLGAAAFFRILGAVLLVYGVGIFMLSRQESIPVPAAVAIIALDVGWTAISWWIILAGVWPLSTAGAFVVGGLADIVLIFGLVQAWGLRQMLRSA